MNAPIQSLEEWLRLATDTLTAPAKERIRQEIESHIQEAMEAYQAEGRSELHARAQALADLGDPRKAAKRFRKFHLTVKEAEQIEKACGQYWKQSRYPWLRTLGFGLCLSILVLSLAFEPSAVIPVTIFSIVLLSLPRIKKRIAQNNQNPSSIRHIYALDILHWLVLLVVFAYLWLGFDPGSGSHGIPNWVLVLGIWAGSSTEMFRVIPLWLKISRMDDFSRELPPPGTVS